MMAWDLQSCIQAKQNKKLSIVISSLKLVKVIKGLITDIDSSDLKIYILYISLSNGQILW